jgi:hypothetical protein
MVICRFESGIEPDGGWLSRIVYGGQYICGLRSVRVHSSTMAYLFSTDDGVSLWVKQRRQFHPPEWYAQTCIYSFHRAIFARIDSDHHLSV